MGMRKKHHSHPKKAEGSSLSCVDRRSDEREGKVGVGCWARDERSPCPGNALESDE